MLLCGGFLFVGMHKGTEGIIKVWNMANGSDHILTGHKVRVRAGVRMGADGCKREGVRMGASGGACLPYERAGHQGVGGVEHSPHSARSRALFGAQPPRARTSVRAAIPTMQGWLLHAPLLAPASCKGVCHHLLVPRRAALCAWPSQTPRS